jgi:2-aminoethylphosphonate-pyruvate transaminase
MPLNRILKSSISHTISTTAITTTTTTTTTSTALSHIPVLSTSTFLKRCFTMSNYNHIPSSRNPHFPDKKDDKLLFTPGPLTTSYSVKEAMLSDLGSRDHAFIRVIQEVRDGLLEIANLSKNEYTTIPVQGSGTFGVESVLSTIVPKSKSEGGLLIIANGSYGSRMVSMATIHSLPYIVYECSDNVLPNVNEIETLLKDEKNAHISHIAMVHSETTSGIVNNIEDIGRLSKKYNKSFIVDAMSSFGGIPIDFKACNIDYLVSSANKCVEGVPGFSFVIARKAAIPAKYTASTLSLDFIAQAKGLDKDGQFRFTPPTHALLAFRQALRELDQEGGITKRYARYQENQRVLMKGMEKMGFQLYLEPSIQGCIISSYRYPTDKNWSFEKFYTELNNLDLVIYPGKVSKADCFRIGHIGRLFPEDTQKLVNAIEQVCKKMKTAGFYSA